MHRVNDNFGSFACMADAVTGLVEHEYKRCRVSMVVPIGGRFTIERSGRVTIVMRTETGFIATSAAA